MFRRFPYIIKKYNDDKYKIVVFKSENYKLSKRKENPWEGVDPLILEKLGVKLPREKWIGDQINERWVSNLYRAKARVVELGYCNDWEYFVTFTLDPQKYDRSDLNKFRKDLAQFLRDMGKKYNTKIDYILIPELHKDGESWHMHGLLHGLPFDQLQRLTSDMKLPYKILSNISDGLEIYTWEEYSKRFGYVTLSPLRDKERAVSYILKYIAKGFQEGDKQLEKLGRGFHLFYASQGLKSAQRVLEDDFTGSDFNRYVKDNLFESDFVFTSWLDSEQAKTFLK